MLTAKYPVEGINLSFTLITLLDFQEGARNEKNELTNLL